MEYKSGVFYFGGGVDRVFGPRVPQDLSGYGKTVGSPCTPNMMSGEVVQWALPEQTVQRCYHRLE